MTTDSKYKELDRVLKSAFAQAADGKGRERHANEKAFQDQPILAITRMVGHGGHIYQIMKKAQEAGGMANRKEYERAIAELYGVIIYSAAAVLYMEEQADAEGHDKPSPKLSDVNWVPPQ